MHWAADKLYAGHPKADVLILFVANVEGMQSYKDSRVYTNVNITIWP